MNKSKPILTSPAVPLTEAIKQEEPLLDELVAAYWANEHSHVIEVTAKIASLRTLQQAASHKLELP